MRENSRCDWLSVAGIHAVGATSVSGRRSESWVVENRVMAACAEQYVTVQDRIRAPMNTFLLYLVARMRAKVL